MIIRDIDDGDYDIINKLNKEQDFKLQNIANVIIDKIMFDDNNNPIAYGIVKRQGEAIILVNPKVSLTKRVKALRELMKWAEFGALVGKCEQLHCFVKDERLAGMLEKHFGFVRTSDIVLVKNL